VHQFSQRQIAARSVALQGVEQLDINGIKAICSI
jgi:hypothetical protein